MCALTIGIGNFYVYKMSLEAKNLDKLLNCIGNVGDEYTILENSKCDALVGELQREKMLSEVTKKSAKNDDQNATIEILVLIMFAAFGILFFSFLLNAVILEKYDILNMLLGISFLMTATLVSYTLQFRINGYLALMCKFFSVDFFHLILT